MYGAETIDFSFLNPEPRLEMERDWPNETGHRREEGEVVTAVITNGKNLRPATQNLAQMALLSNSDDDLFHRPKVTRGFKYFPAYPDCTSTSQQADSPKDKEEEITIPEFKRERPPPFLISKAPHKEKEKKKMTMPYQIIIKPKEQAAEQQHQNQKNIISYEFSDEDEERQTKPADLDLKLVDYGT